MASQQGFLDQRRYDRSPIPGCVIALALRPHRPRRGHRCLDLIALFDRSTVLPRSLVQSHRRVSQHSINRQLLFQLHRRVGWHQVRSQVRHSDPLTLWSQWLQDLDRLGIRLRPRSGRGPSVLLHCARRIRRCLRSLVGLNHCR